MLESLIVRMFHSDSRLCTKISRKHLRTVIQGSQEGAFPARFCVRLLFATLLVFKDKLVVIGVVNVWRAIMFVHRFLLLASSLQKECGLPHDLNPINLVLTNMHAVIDFGIPISLDVADTRIVGASYNAKKINMMYAYIEINRRNSDLYKLHVATHHRSRHKRNSGDNSSGDPSLPNQVKTGTCNFAGSGCIVVMGIESLVQLQEIIDHLVELLGPIFVESKSKTITHVQ